MLSKLIKKVDWMSILFIVGFTFSILLCFQADYEITKNIFFIIGICSSYILVSLVSDEAKKEWKKEQQDIKQKDSEVTK